MPFSKYQVFHKRRSLLLSVMNQAGFVQHPNEWWHFSYGDQLWAWVSHMSKAHYGAFNPSESRDRTTSSPRVST